MRLYAVLLYLRALKTLLLQYSTQIDVNLVTAIASGHSGELQLDQPFTQYGKPDGPAKIKKFNGDGAAWYVNNPVGSLRVEVLDQYDNVVSNVTVTFSAQTAESIDPSITLPTVSQGFRNIEFYKSEECNPDRHIAYPLHGDCATYYGGQTGVGVKTEYFGAVVNAVLGNTVNTKYKVKATALIQSAETFTTFTLSTFGSRDNADGYISPSLQITRLELYNDRGELVNAAKAGTELKAPLTAALALYTEETTTEGPYQCTINNQQTNCWKVKPVGVIKTKKIADGTVTFTPKDGNGLVTATTITNSQYQTRYTTGVTAAKNTIEAFGEAAVFVPEVFYDTANNCSASKTAVPVDKEVTVKSGQFIAFEKDSGQAHTGICGVDPATHQTACGYDTGQYEKVTYTVFGVNAALTIEPEIVLLNDEGYSTVDTTFKYTILPPEYNAIIADVDIYKTGANNADEWINYIPGDKTQGQGTAGFVQGTKFDINTHYKAQVVLNRGTDIEITSTSEINTDNAGNNNGICEANEACKDKVTIPVAQIRILTDENLPKEPEEVKFSDGSNNSNGTKKYHIAIKSQSWLSTCETLTGRIVTLSTSTATMGQPVSTPQINNGNASEHPIHFIASGNECYPKIKDTVDGYSDKDKFIISNRSRTDLDIGLPSHVYNTAVLYAGLGNNFMIEVGGVQKMLPIEPVGVVVLGIDGLRQDVLYAPSGTNDGTGVHASYSDTVGPGFSSPYYVPLSAVEGFCAVMGGKYDDGIFYSSCDPAGASDKHIKLEDVTTIFPSITFAAWASIFTGMTPSATGITGNEFFARDMLANYETIPGMYMLPSGMVTLDADGGAFRPLIPGGSYSWLDITKSLPFILNYIMPADFGIYSHPTLQSKLDESAPGHALRTEVKPLWADINTLVAKRYKRISDAKCDAIENECRTVSMFNQYAEGADGWGTSGPISRPLFEAVQLPGGVGTSYSAALMDSSSADETAAFISSYLPNNPQNGKRKNFPALLSVYLSGLDHYAHIEGMAEYADYVKSTTDGKLKKIVNALKDEDEFDNKIFIIVSDHGETAMPWDYNVDVTNPATGQVKSLTPETSCELNMKNFDTFKVQAPEQANNSLHIWEMGEMFTSFAPSSAGIKLLAPTELNNTGVNITQNPYQANVVAALNGPMAHIYVKGGDWQGDPDETRLGVVIDTLIRALTLGDNATDKVKKELSRLTASVDKILVRRTLTGAYEVVISVGEDASGIVTISTDSLGSLNNTEYQRAVSRITEMNHANRSGDVVLIMKDDTLGNAIDRYSTAYGCKSWHGSLNSSDSYVPFIVSYPGGNKSELDAFLSPVCPGNNCDGNWKLADLVEEIFNKQYGKQ